MSSYSNIITGNTSLERILSSVPEAIGATYHQPSSYPGLAISNRNVILISGSTLTPPRTLSALLAIRATHPTQPVRSVTIPWGIDNVVINNGIDCNDNNVSRYSGQTRHRDAGSDYSDDTTGILLSIRGNTDKATSAFITTLDDSKKEERKMRYPDRRCTLKHIIPVLHAEAIDKINGHDMLQKENGNKLKKAIGAFYNSHSLLERGIRMQKKEAKAIKKDLKDPGELKCTRVQFELNQSRYKELEALRKTVNIRTKKELINNALSILEWMVEEGKSGRVIASVDKQAGTYRAVCMPLLSSIPIDEEAKKRETNRLVPA